ncbi:MAG: hypothetical protein WCT23_01100 [Candidatus Neomarinimicrobiota bacterium]|jgi:hypothetical protein
MKQKQWIKVLTVWVLYVSLHFTYEYIPCGLTQLLACPQETLFHHMKMAFFVYSLVSFVEYFILKPFSKESFISSRMISAILISYLSFVIWIFVPLVFGPIHQVWLEILYSNLVLGSSLAATIYLETSIEKISFNKKLTSVIIAIYSIVLIVFILAAFTTPDIEIFAPYGHGH